MIAWAGSADRTAYTDRERKRETESLRETIQHSHFQLILREDKLHSCCWALSTLLCGSTSEKQSSSLLLCPGGILFLIQINWDIPCDMLPSFPCLSSECSLNVQSSSCSLIKAVAVLQREWLSTEEPGLLARVGQWWRSIRRKKRENCSRKHKGKKENKKQTNIKYCFGAKWISLLLGVSTCSFKSLLALVLIGFSLFFTLFLLK